MKKLLPFLLGIEIMATIAFGALSYARDAPCTPGWSLIQSTGPQVVNCPPIPVSGFIGTYLNLFYLFGSALVITLIFMWAKHSLRKHAKTSTKQP